ncbi:MAG TPA: hypothetical protein VMU20_16400 [Candidatus Dormibacteraeota bacterium]|nr:hypothetical protein [Candidatus Dormibacteraeota bacterium]
MIRAHRLAALALAVVPLLAACGFEKPAIPILTRETLSRVLYAFPDPVRN